MKFYRAISSLLFLFTLSTSILGAEYSAVLSANIEFTDNVRLVTDEKEVDAHQTISLSGSVVEERKTFQTSANFSLEKDHYFGGAYEGETSLSTGLGLLNFDVIEEFLSWHTSYTRSQTLDDPLEEDLPGNRGHRDTVSTGPSMSYILSPTMQLSGEGRYTIVENSQEETADTERASISAGIAHQLNSISSMNLFSQYEVMIDGDGDEKYDRYQLGAGFSRLFVDGRVNLSVGRTLLVPELTDNSESNYFSLAFSREDLWLHDVTLSYLEDVSDTSVGFIQNEPGVGAISFEGNDIVKRRSASIDIERVMGVYQYSLNFAWDYEDYRLQDSDEKTKGVGFSLGKDIFSSLSAEVNIDLDVTEYLGRPDIGKEITRTYEVRSDYQFSQVLNVGGFIQHIIRQNPGNAVREYEEVSLGVDMSWSLL